jgi:hypothetical protein
MTRLNINGIGSRVLLKRSPRITAATGHLGERIDFDTYKVNGTR